jgi:epoxyqueuosine reductase
MPNISAEKYFRMLLTQAAKEQGFDQIGFAPAAVLEQEGHEFAQFLAEGRHGGMQWLERDPQKRSDPSLLLPGARTVMAVGANYYSDRLPETETNRIARYARGRDYHNFLPKRLKKAVRQVQEKFPIIQAKVCVDTSPILEKPWAQRAGLGWQGKHTHLVSRTHGSWLLLGLVILNVEVEYDAPHPDVCGNCNACVEACPTGALTPHKMDATKCISNWTIEHRGPFPENAPDLSGWIHGCDLCLQACPWNKFSIATTWADFEPRYAGLTDEELADGEALATRLPGTPLARPGVAGLQRNARLKPVAGRPEPVVGRRTADGGAEKDQN